MSRHYRLQPPFLYVSEEQDFSKAWEYFCCKLLNISNKTTEIYIRNPPEQGIDIFYPSKKIAYQCKSVESGKSGDFNVSKIVESIEAAKKIKSELGWEEYVLCTNVALTGTAETNLKKALPDIKILSNSHWVQLCELNPIEVERNFRILIDVPRSKVIDAIHNRFIDDYSEQLKLKIESTSFDIFLYSNRHDKTYRLPVSESFTCKDLLSLFREFFKLPESSHISSEEINVSLSHSIVFNGKKVILSNTLTEAGIGQGDVITYWTKIIWKNAKEEFNGNVMHMITAKMMDNPIDKTLKQRKNDAISQFSQILNKYFQEFDNGI